MWNVLPDRYQGAGEAGEQLRLSSLINRLRC